MDTQEKYLGPFSESLNLPVCDLLKNGILAERQIPIGFLHELRYQWKLKSHQDVVHEILKLKPGLSKVSAKVLKRKLSTCLNRVKLYMDRKDERLESYLKQNLVIKIPSSQIRGTESSTDDLYDDLIDENESSSDNMLQSLTGKNTEDGVSTTNRNVFQEVDRNTTITENVSKDSDHENMEVTPTGKDSSALNFSFSDETVGGSSYPCSIALTQYLQGQVTTEVTNQGEEQLDLDIHPEQSDNLAKDVDVDVEYPNRNGNNTPEQCEMGSAAGDTNGENVALSLQPLESYTTGVDIETHSKEDSVGNKKPEHHEIGSVPCEQSGLDSIHTGSSRSYGVVKGAEVISEPEDRDEVIDVNGNPSPMECDDEAVKDIDIGVDHEYGNSEEIQVSTTLSDYWPSEKMMSMADLNTFLLCKLCNCYLFRATTVKECMHTYCRKCIYYHIERSTKCPQCGAYIDPSNPIVGLREDKMYQQLVDKILPHITEQERKSKEEFNKKYNLPLQRPGIPQNSVEKKKTSDRWISLKMTYIGRSHEITSYIQKLDKPFLLLPTEGYIRHIEKYLTLKLFLDEHCKCLLFYSDFILHEDFSLSDLLELHTENNPEDKLVELCYCVVPSGPDYFNLLPSNADIDSDPEYTLSPEDQNSTSLTGRSSLSRSCKRVQDQGQWKCYQCGEVTENLNQHIKGKHDRFNLCQQHLLYLKSERLLETQRPRGETGVCLMCNEGVCNAYYHAYKKHSVTNEIDCRTVLKLCTA